jgi:hypothetical protein
MDSRDLLQRHVGTDGSIAWPHDDHARAALSRALLGKDLVSSLDTCIGRAIDLIERREPDQQYRRPDSSMARRDRYFRDGLADLSEKERTIVRHLVEDAVHGILFSTLVALDQPVGGDYTLFLRLRDEAAAHEPIRVAASGTTLDLHDELNEWIWSFSELSEDLVERKQISPGCAEYGRKNRG